MATEKVRLKSDITALNYVLTAQAVQEIASQSTMFGENRWELYQDLSNSWASKCALRTGGAVLVTSLQRVNALDRIPLLWHDSFGIFVGATRWAHRMEVVQPSRLSDTWYASRQIVLLLSNLSNEAHFQ